MTDREPGLLSPVPAPVPPPHRHRLSRFAPRSLVTRLVSGVVLLVVVLVLAIGTSTFLLLRRYLYDQLGTQVDAVAASNAARFHCSRTTGQCTLYFDGYTGTTTPNASPLQTPVAEWIALYDQANNELLPSAGPRDGPQPMQISTAAAAALADAGTSRTITTRDGIRLRTVAVPSQLVPGVYVLTGLSTASVDQALSRLVVLETTIGGVAVAVALVASLSGVSFGLRGLRRVTHTAQDVTAELSATGAGLDRRVPVDASTDAEVGQLATSVNTLLGAVQTQFAARIRSEERMREFLADASHELRTPLTSIRGFAELARMQRRQAAQQAGLGPDATDDDTLDRIESEGTRMSRLVDDLLLLARSDHGAPAARERVDVADMVHEVVRSARVAHPDRPIDEDVPPGLAVLGDRDQLLRVVRNLVTNAAVHTAPGGPILVSARPEGEEAVIQVADSGPGLPPEQAAHVFERFWRADKARTRARGGSGLGMSIVATIVENHQGAVRFDSTPESGSTVTVILPAAPGAPGTPAAPPAPPAPRAAPPAPPAAPAPEPPAAGQVGQAGGLPPAPVAPPVYPPPPLPSA